MDCAWFGRTSPRAECLRSATVRRAGEGGGEGRGDFLNNRGTICLFRLPACVMGAGGVKMARMVVIYKQPENPRAFDQHYFDVHVPLAKTLPGLKRYEAS